MKKIIISMVVILAVFSAYVLFIQRTPTSTHHALIKADIDPSGIHGDEYTKQRKAHVEQIISTLTAVLNAAGLIDVTNSKVPLNSSTVGNAENNRTLKFKGPSTGKDNTISLEAIIIYDSERYEKLSIHLAEGYSLEPSKDLSELYIKLDQAFDDIEGDKYISKIW